MELRNHITRRLHDEHEAAFRLMTRVERTFTGPAVDSVPAPAAPEWNALLRDLKAALEFEIAAHFEFEERALFPLLVEAGEGDMVGILADEHEAIRAVAAPVIELLRKFAGAGLDAAEWRSLRKLGLELCLHLEAHARKEEAAMLPALEALLDAELDRELTASYAAGA